MVVIDLVLLLFPLHLDLLKLLELVSQLFKLESLILGQRLYHDIQLTSGGTVLYFKVMDEISDLQLYILQGLQVWLAGAC